MNSCFVSYRKQGFALFGFAQVRCHLVLCCYGISKRERQKLRKDEFSYA